MNPSYRLKCPICGHNLLKTDGGRAVLTARTIIIRGDEATGKCPRCKQRVLVPVKLATEQ